MEKKKKGPKGPLIFVSGNLDRDTQAIESLEKDGFDVNVVKDPARTIAVCETKPANWKPTIFVVDVSLPGMSGYELVRRICEKYGEKKMPILMVGQHISPEDKLESHNAGATAITQRPLEVAAIHQIFEAERIRKLNAENASTVVGLI